MNYTFPIKRHTFQGAYFIQPVWEVLIRMPFVRATAILNGDGIEVRASAAWGGGSWNDGNGVNAWGKDLEKLGRERLAVAIGHCARGLLVDDNWRYVGNRGGDAHQRRKFARAVRRWAQQHATWP